MSNLFFPEARLQRVTGTTITIKFTDITIPISEATMAGDAEDGRNAWLVQNRLLLALMCTRSESTREQPRFVVFLTLSPSIS